MYDNVVPCSDRFLPDKAIDLIDEAGSRVRLQNAQVYSICLASTISSSFYYSDNIGCNSMNFQLPEEARELDKEVRQIIKEKEEAARNQDFEKVMYL